ncbi:hypothetical protein V5O48_013236 [Marasmius crinis-equi]|uniref:SCP domain-containing protein n=1 Tax=Marasmius crinis-equi TaxID=585013 RepID=A0ABR3F0T7_9AGAR
MNLIFSFLILAIAIPNAFGNPGARSQHRRQWKRMVKVDVEPQHDLVARCNGLECVGGGNFHWSTTWSTAWTSTFSHNSPAQTQAPPASSTPPSSNNGQAYSGGGGTSDADQDRYLKLHNDLRNQHGAGPLQWNNTLETAAQDWANRCVFEHSHGAIGPFGENLSTGTGDMSIEAAVKMWIDEAGQYNPNNPQYSHFTQMVWKGSTQVGCAVADGCHGIFDSSYGAAKLYVCEYYPAGNVIGQFL